MPGDGVRGGSPTSTKGRFERWVLPGRDLPQVVKYFAEQDIGLSVMKTFTNEYVEIKYKFSI